MYFERSKKSKRAFTLVEMVVAVGVFGIAAAALMSLYFYSSKSFASLANYADLNKINRSALDTLTREIRQAKLVTGYSTNSIVFINGDGHTISYYFNNSAKTFVRTDVTASTYKTLVSSCQLLNFDVYQRNNISNTFNQYPAAVNNWSETVKVIRLTWKASRTILGTQKTSEDIQTARVIIRKQH